MLTRNTRQHIHSPRVLLPKEVTYVNRRVVIRCIDIDGEMSINCLHLVLVTLGQWKGCCLKCKRLWILRTNLTPLIRLLMWLHTVCRQASCFLFANHTSTRSFCLFTATNSQFMWRRDFLSVPLGPLTVITLFFAVTVTTETHTDTSTRKAR